MCGVIGILSSSPVNQEIFDGLTALQHRGQDAAGIASCDETGKVHIVKGRGLVRDVIRMRHMIRLQGNLGIGHVRYPTAGTDTDEEAQPLYVNAPYGLCLAHNGNLTNVDEIKSDVIQDNLRHLNTHSDSEVLLNVLAHELQSEHKRRLDHQAVFNAVEKLHARVKGAYAAVVMVANYGLIAFRDPFGIRPLIVGRRKVGDGYDYMVSSESVALDILGYEVIDDIKPGEAVYITIDGQFHRKVCTKESQLSPCIFEFVYLARPDSMIDDISVYKVRLKLGEAMAKKIKQQWPDYDIDVVMPIPDTSRTAASVLARRLGIKFREGFVKNRYIGRTFIMPGQQVRKRSVRQKLNTVPLEFKNKNVLLVDDSIVRGTTSKEIIQMAREAGAKKVYFASAAPEIRFANIYGIDMPAVNELIAYNKTNQQICDSINADAVIFQDLEALYKACSEGKNDIQRFEDSVFTGDYVTGDISEAYFKELENNRGEMSN
jgi:amidophosphoribosyltransferase